MVSCRMQAVNPRRLTRGRAAGSGWIVPAFQPFRNFKKCQPTGWYFFLSGPNTLGISCSRGLIRRGGVLPQAKHRRKWNSLHSRWRLCRLTDAASPLRVLRPSILKSPGVQKETPANRLVFLFVLSARYRCRTRPGPRTAGRRFCAVQAFCRRQNLGVGAIHLPLAFEISQDSIKITTPNGVVIFMSCP